MRILVTGGAGFIGSHITDLLIEKGHKVAVVDDLSHGKKENINKKAVFFKEDICNPAIKTIFKKFRPEAVSHQAALVNVNQSLQQPLADVKVNVGGTLQVLEAAKACKTKQVIFASSAAVYGDTTKIPINENQEVSPISIYGASKAAAEAYARLYNDYFITTILRYANVYGPRQSSSAEGGVVAIFSQAIQKGKKCRIFGNGRQMRDFVFVKDVAQANYSLIKKAKSGIFNVSTGREISILKLCHLCQEITGTKKEPIFNKPRKGDIYKSVLANGLIKKSLGWQPKISLKQGLTETIASFS